MFDIMWVKEELVDAWLSNDKNKAIRIISLLKDLQISQKNIANECNFSVLHFTDHQKIQPLINKWEEKLEKWDE